MSDIPFAADADTQIALGGQFSSSAEQQGLIARLSGLVDDSVAGLQGQSQVALQVFWESYVSDGTSNAIANTSLGDGQILSAQTQTAAQKRDTGNSSLSSTTNH